MLIKETFREIQERLEFYNDYSTINKKCFGCRQFNHIIEECPKLHYVPNVEKIIKQYNFSLGDIDRRLYNRRKKKNNSLKMYNHKLQSVNEKFKFGLLKVDEELERLSSDADQVYYFIYNIY